ncbi:hypothetical protein N0V85_007246 [Neurospora sp. IMI 360204]|nr:hypothetical protein N0V85_007246 [Neurospora sp. IMI 360204]
MNPPPSVADQLRLTQQKPLVSRLLAVKPCPSGPPYTSSLQISRDDPFPVPGPHEVCIRTRAVGLNHIDWKNLEHEIMVKQWPEVLGFEIAGVVELVGMDVEARLQVGQEVFGLSGPVGIMGGPPASHPFPAIRVGKGGPDDKGGDGKKSAGEGKAKKSLEEILIEEAEKADSRLEEKGVWTGRAGGFQDVTCVHMSWVTRKPASWGFERAAGVPLVYITACSAIVCGLGIQLPFLANNKPAFDDSLHLESLTIDTTSPIATHNDPRKTGADELKDIPENKFGVKSVLVLGGSSGVGGSAIQLLRMALGPKAVIIATSNNEDSFPWLQKCGATAHLRGEFEALAEKVRLLTEGKGVDAILDCISGAACLDDSPPTPPSRWTDDDVETKKRCNEKENVPKDDKDKENSGPKTQQKKDKSAAGTDKITIKDDPESEITIKDIPELKTATEDEQESKAMSFWDVFREDGPKLYAEVATGRKVDVPTDRGIRATLVFSIMILSQPGGERALQELPALIESGEFIFPHPGGVKVVGKGLESVAPVLAELREGSGGWKFVVEL